MATTLEVPNDNEQEIKIPVSNTTHVKSWQYGAGEGFPNLRKVLKELGVEF